MELVSALEEGAASNFLVDHVVKLKATKGAFMVDVEDAFSSDSKEKVHAFASTSTLGLIHPLSFYVLIT